MPPRMINVKRIVVVDSSYAFKDTLSLGWCCKWMCEWGSVIGFSLKKA